MMQCLGPKLQDLQPVRRHFVGAVVFDGPDILFLSGGTPEERWASVAPTLARVTESFFVTAR